VTSSVDTIDFAVTIDGIPVDSVDGAQIDSNSGCVLVQFSPHNPQANGQVVECTFAPGLSDIRSLPDEALLGGFVISGVTVGF